MIPICMMSSGHVLPKKKISLFCFKKQNLTLIKHCNIGPMYTLAKCIQQHSETKQFTQHSLVYTKEQNVYNIANCLHRPSVHTGPVYKTQPSVHNTAQFTQHSPVHTKQPNVHNAAQCIHHSTVSIPAQCTHRPGLHNTSTFIRIKGM